MNDEELQVCLIPWDSREYWQALQLRDEVLRKPLGMSLFNDDLSQEEQDIHVGAFQEGILLGTLVLSPRSERLRMRQVAVAENSRGRSVGTRMVQFAERLAYERGFRRMELHARQTAVPFYLQNGYDCVGEEFTEIGIAHVRMVKMLVCP